MKYNALKLFGKEILAEAGEFSSLCAKGKRWNGKPILIVLDSCLDSSGLNYFTVVMPKVIKFEEKYVETGIAERCRDFSKIKRSELIYLFRNRRVWNAMSRICSFLSSMTEKQEFNKLREWAKNADPSKIQKDPIGSIKGIGISTFQYLRMQSGMDVIMPDKVIKKWIIKNFRYVKNSEECIEYGKYIADKMNISRTQFCWAIWIKESNELNKIKVK